MCDVNLEMESRKIRSTRFDDNPDDRKISRGLVRHVMTRNTGDRIALGKVTRQLDKERIAKELDFQHQKQKLLLQTFETHMKEHSERGGHESDMAGNDSASQRLADLRIAPGKSLNLRCRSYSEQDPSSLQLRGSKCPMQFREVREGKEATETSLHSRETVENDSDRARKASEHPTRTGEVEKLKRTRTLSDILPSLILPPIHKTCTGPLAERRKNPENQRITGIKAKAIPAGCEGPVRTNQTPVTTQIDDLEDCRYLRKSKFR